MNNSELGTKPASSIGNILTGVGIFVLGIPVAFFALILSALSGFSVWTLVWTVLIYGLIGYVLGKIKPNLGWKSGIILSLGAVFVIIALAYMKRLVDVSDGNLMTVVILTLLVIAALGTLGAYLGSRSQKTWKGPISNVIFVLVCVAVAMRIFLFISNGLSARQISTPPIDLNNTLSP